MKKFTYTGSQSHNSTISIDRDGKKVNEDVRLSNGDEMELQEDHPVIKSMIDSGLLIESNSGKQNSTNKKS